MQAIYLFLHFHQSGPQLKVLSLRGFVQSIDILPLLRYRLVELETLVF